MMKKFIIAALFTTLLAGGLKAQDVGIGGGLIYGTEVEEAGLNLRANLPVSGPWVITPYFNIFFMESNDAFRQSFFTINADAHYMFDMDNGLYLYPLAGLNFASSTVKNKINDTKANDTALGFNLGGGLEYGFSDNLAGIFEFKFIASEYDQAVLNFGLVYYLD